MLQSLNDIKSNSIDICFRVVDVLLKLLNDIINHPNQPKFRRLYLNSDVIQNDLLPFSGAMEFLFEIGFIDDGISLVLPDCIILSTLNNYKQQLINIISEHQKLNLNENNFLKEISSTSLTVLKFEDKILQSKALENLSPEDIELFSNFDKNNDSFYHEKMMLKLMIWFKKSFFKWFDTPTCHFCCSSTKFKGINHNKLDENVKYSELYECDNCGSITNFKRYGICEQLLTTRQGRCGEWANCFTLFCRALGWEARLVIDKTDHVWTEVWSVNQKRWIHCDPCETALDKPLLYEKGWGKKLSYILAYSHEEVQDVTWRYVENSDSVLKRRTLCSENELLNTILSLSQHKQNNLSLSRRKYIAERRLKECIEMLFQTKCTDENYGGRTSGAITWRLARREIQIEKFVWTPSETEIANKRFELKYSTAFDKYIHGNSIHEGWKSGVYSYSSIFRKEELDWKTVYLCREENCEKSTIEWRFDFSSTGLVVQDIKLIYTTALFNTGEVEWKLIGNNATVNLPTIENIKEVIVDQIKGSDFVTLNASLTGGSGDSAWQHSQIFRQSIKDQDYPFHIVIILK